METPKAYPATPEEEAAQTVEMVEVTEDVFQWFQLRHELQSGLQPLWRAAVSTDAAESFARGFLHPGHGSGPHVDPLDERWPDIGLQVRKLAAAMATAAGMMPLQYTDKLDAPAPDSWRPLAQAECGWSVVATMRAGADVAAGQLVKVQRSDQPVEQLFMRGWTPERLCASVNGLLALDNGLISAASLLTQVASEKAKARWQAFDAGGPLTPTPGHDGIALFGLTEGDAERVRALWAPYLPVIETPENGPPRPIAGPGVAGVARLALRMVEEARQREAEAEARALEEAKRKRPAVIRDVMADVMATSFSQVHLNLGGPVPVATIDGRVFAKLENPDARIDLLASVPGLRLISALVRTVHKAFVDGATDFRAVEYEGGWQALVERHGMLTRGTKNAATWRDIAEAGQALKFYHEATTTNFGGLWTYTDRRGGPGVRGCVRFVVGDALAPQAHEQLPDHNGLAAREARRLVPVLDYDFPVTLDASKHAAQYRAGHGLVVAMVDRAPTIAKHGGVLLDERAWCRIASNARLDFGDLPRVRDAWRAGDDRTPPFIASEGEAVRLADEHALQWAFIVEGGARRAKGSASGRKAAAARQSDEVEARRSKRVRK